MYMRQPTQLINCDWLQFFGHHHGIVAGITDKGTCYKLKFMNRGTRVFKDVVQIWERSTVTRSHRDELLATVTINPFSSILQPNMFICKVENKVLYQEDLFTRVHLMCNALGLSYEGITRFDLCVDLYEFACLDLGNSGHEADNITPLSLLRAYRKNRYIKSGSRRYSDWRTAPLSPSMVTGMVDDDLLSAEHITHCVSWGGASSDVHVKMYNKSHEIRESSGKQYIAAYWRANGLDEKRDVWRVEISVTRRSKYLFDNSSGDVVPVSLEMVTKRVFMNEVFSAMVSRHFKWFYYKRGCHSKHRVELNLFNVSNCTVFKPAAPESKPIAGRTAKVCANYLEQLANTTDWDTLIPNKPYTRDVIEIAHETLTYLYEGLSTLRIENSGKPRPSKQELLEKMEWLRMWKCLPDQIDGIDTWKIDDLIEGNARMLLMEEIALRRHEFECHMMFLANYEDK